MRTLQAMSSGGYLAGSTAVHAADPRAKIVLVSMFAVLALITPHPGWLLLLMALVLAVGRLAGIDTRMLFARARPLMFILVITVVIHAIEMTQPTTGIYWQVGSVFLSTGGLLEGAFFAGRLLLIIVGTSLLGMTTAPMDLVDGMSALLSPLKRLSFNVEGLAMTLGLALRFVPTVVAEGDRITRAQMARGSSIRTGGISRRGKAVTSIVIPLFVSSLRRARDLSFALEAKGYDGVRPRNRMVPMVWKPSDTIAIVGFVVLFGLATLHALILI